jgi:GcrA cell cycle regulator
MWTEERVELLRKLWTEGLSASQIAKQLGGVTRNAVIGKVHRLGLQGRATPSRPARRPVRIARPRPASNSAAAPHIARPRPAPRIVDVEPLRFEDGATANVLTIRDQMCKWPVGDPGDKDFGFCGHPVQDGCPYCTEHAQAAYQPQTRRKRSDEGSRRDAETLRWARLATM